MVDGKYGYILTKLFTIPNPNIYQRALLLPALLYFVSNVLTIYSLSHLRSYIFTAIMNTRIVIAASLSLLLLEKSINGEQWRAILIVFCAATVLCLEDVHIDRDHAVDETVGMATALGAATVSAAGGILMEKYLNSSPAAIRSFGIPSVQPSRQVSLSIERDIVQQGGPNAISALWEQQGVLALFSAGFAGLYLTLFHPEVIQNGSLFKNWSPITTLISFMQAGQGILVATTIQQCGIVFRLILGTVSICLCILLESALFSEPVALREVMVIAIVVLGSAIYFNASAKTCT